MEVSAVISSSLMSPMQERVQASVRAEPASRPVREPVQNRVDSVSISSSEEQRRLTENRDDPQKTVARKAEAPAIQAEPQSKIRFETEGNRQVMKVADSKGVLIYQIPSEGKLRLVAEQQAQQSRLETQA